MEPAPGPALDEPQSIEVDLLDSATAYLLANQEVRFVGDAQSDLRDLVWPWADATYARRIALTFTVYHGDNLFPLVNRYYPGYQETILGSEGLIISKRLAAPFKSADERALLWTCECQAEADLIVRFDVAIDWGEPLSQRIVDGLLVAQRNPRPEQGIYRQSNAESTRIFGNPHGPPEHAQLDDEAGTAHLVYYVLVHGMADVSLLLTLSDVGEQVAWNSFLALRDSERAFELSNRAWQDALKTARLWTPDTRLNRAVQAGKQATLQHLVHLRSGMAPSDRVTLHVPPLVESLDALDATQSRNLLAHLRRLAERSRGRLPLLLPRTAKEPPAEPGRALPQTNGAYLAALHAHLSRHPNRDLLADHADAVALCAEALVAARREALHNPSVAELQALGAALRSAQALAELRRDGANTVRWESEACEYERWAEREGGARSVPMPAPDWARAAGWHAPGERPAGFDDHWAGIALAGDAVWRGCGLRLEREQVRVAPVWSSAWEWWALLGLHFGGGTLSLVWDGAQLHSTLPLRTRLPVVVHESIRALKTDEDAFDLEFEFTDSAPAADAPRVRRHFRPRFLAG